MSSLTVEERRAFARDLAVVARRWRARLDERLRYLGVSQARWSVLEVLANSDNGLSQKVLAERAGVEPATLVRMIDALEVQGLVQRRGSLDDRRINHIHLTATAEPHIDRMSRIDADLRQELLAGIDPGAIRVANALLTQLRASLERE